MVCQTSPTILDIAIHTGTELCQQLLEPLQQKFGRIAIRSAYRLTPSVKSTRQRKRT
ncbi:hypothetical protein AB2762_04305 [Acinetobacter indicus]